MLLPIVIGVDGEAEQRSLTLSTTYENIDLGHATAGSVQYLVVCTSCVGDGSRFARFSAEFCNRAIRLSAKLESERAQLSR